MTDLSFRDQQKTSCFCFLLFMGFVFFVVYGFCVFRCLCVSCFSLFMSFCVFRCLWVFVVLVQFGSAAS